MSLKINCPICYQTLDSAFYDDEHNRTNCKCNFCGSFKFPGLIKDGHISKKLKALNSIQRVSIAYELKDQSQSGETVLLSSEKLATMMKNTSIPPVSTQIKNIIQYIGNEYNKTGSSLNWLPYRFYILIGVQSTKATRSLLGKLQEENLISFTEEKRSGIGVTNLELTLKGWEQFESYDFYDLDIGKGSDWKKAKDRVKANFNFIHQNRSKSELEVSKSKLGFIAFQYEETILENLVRDHIKPKIKTELDFTVYDMRDVSKAGIIDNLIQTQIRKSRFVIADLTHDNSGAYWEAGFATAVGIPVIYICEKKKFEEVKTHFDTSHWTTVLWTHGDEPNFCKKLIKTIKNSLNLIE